MYQLSTPYIKCSKATFPAERQQLECLRRLKLDRWVESTSKIKWSRHCVLEEWVSVGGSSFHTGNWLRA
jgi:hypothetical protein